MQSVVPRGGLTRGTDAERPYVYIVESDRNPSIIMGKEKVALVGSGNWGSAIATKIGKSVQTLTDLFEPTIHMWVSRQEKRQKSWLRFALALEQA